jgi:hypothetical protein
MSFESRALRVGTYGFAIHGLPDARAVLNAAPDAWPEWTVRTRRASREEVVALRGRNENLDHEFARLYLTDSVALLDRRRSSVDIVTCGTHTDATVVHPLLASTAAIVAWWSDDLAFHAGAYAADDGRAWIVVGERERGKSTTLASLAAAGVPVLADDVTVVRGGRAMAGPRCIDLRADAGATVSKAVELGRIGDRERWRLSISDVNAEYPVAGLIELQWGDEVALRRKSPGLGLRTVIRGLSLSIAPRESPRVLELAELPVYDMVRPKTRDSLAPVVQLLRRLV